MPHLKGRVGWGRNTVGKFLSEVKRLTQRSGVRRWTERKILPLCRKHSTKPKTKNRRIVFCCSSMSVASAEGSLWDTAVAILMLRHCIEAVNAELSRNKKTRSTQRTKRPRDLIGNHQKKQPPKCAKRTSPNDNEAPPEKRRNGGGDVFSGGCARRALRPAPPGEARTW